MYSAGLAGKQIESSPCPFETGKNRQPDSMKDRVERNPGRQSPSKGEVGNHSSSGKTDSQKKNGEGSKNGMKKDLKWTAQSHFRKRALVSRKRGSWTKREAKRGRGRKKPGNQEGSSLQKPRISKISNDVGKQEGGGTTYRGGGEWGSVW